MHGRLEEYAAMKMIALTLNSPRILITKTKLELRDNFLEGTIEIGNGIFVQIFMDKYKTPGTRERDKQRIRETAEEK